jgi:putative CocE/NonD family hydrolase
VQYQSRLDQVSVPVLHVSGWYDDTQRATPMNFAGMRARAATPDARDHQMMVIGPWPHAINSRSKLGQVDFGPTAVIDLAGLETQWFDRWLRGRESPLGKRVRLFAMQSNQWFEVDDWPIPGTELTKYYLTSGGRANTAAGDGRLEREQAAVAPPDRYRYDPANPTPFLTEPSFAQLGGPDDYAAVEQRPDVLVYTATAFSAPTLVCGPITASISAASSATDTDFMVKLLDLWPTGFVQRLNDGMVRARFRTGWERPELIEPNRVYRYEIDLWNTCQTFLPGHQLRVEVASAAFPKFDRNPNTGDPLGTTSRLQTASQTIYHDREHPSYVVIPIVPLDRLAR